MRKLPKELDQGVYYGWANVDNGDVHKVVLSIGWNPFYDNKEKSMVSESLLYGSIECTRKNYHYIINHSRKKLCQATTDNFFFVLYF